MKKIRLKIPGSTANLGSGFDSIGLAINRYLTLEAIPADQWTFAYSSPEYANIPQDGENLIYKTMKYTADYKGRETGIPPYSVSIDCDIPLARGLGSSAAAIVAGIELANIVLDLSLTQDEKVRIGSLIEGHPDNVGASICGGLTIATHLEDDTYLIPCGKLPVDLVIVVPKEQLLTKTSRNVLPEELPFSESVKASSIANVLVAALLKGDYHTAGKMMTRDLFHQPYRMAIVPELERITHFVQENRNVYGVALSGAGPAVIVYLEKGKGESLALDLQSAFPHIEVEQIESVSKGTEVEIINE